MKLPNNCFYKGTLMHNRFVPKNHKFTYNIFYSFIDIDGLDDLKKKYTFFSYNKFNFFSIYDKDHGFRNNKKIKDWVKNILKKININHMNTKIFLLSIPRIFGYVFNPLSIFFCYDFDGNLKALIYQVKNTFNEQYCYVFKIKDDAKKKYYKHSCKKNFHVSPLWDMRGKYNFLTFKPSNKFYSSIIMEKNKKKVFQAILDCKYQELNFNNFLSLLIKFPFLTIKVILAIYFEAFKIFIFKGAKYYKKNVLKKNFTIIKK